MNRVYVFTHFLYSSVQTKRVITASGVRKEKKRKQKKCSVSGCFHCVSVRFGFSLGRDGASWVWLTMSFSRASLIFWRGGRKWWPSVGSCGCGLKRVSKWEQFELRALSSLSGRRSFAVVCFDLVVVQRSVFCVGVGRGGECREFTAFC
jgi:hypothetical protein